MPIRAKIRLNQEWAEFRVTYLHTNKQIDSSTIDGNVEFVHSHIQLYSYVTSVNSVFASDKIINNSDNFKIKHANLTVK